MKSVYHIISSIDASTGGPARSVTDLLEALSSKTPSTFDYCLFTIESDSPILDSTINTPYQIHFSKKITKDGLLKKKTRINPHTWYMGGTYF